MSDSDLIQLIPGVFYIPGITNVGVICDNTNFFTQVYLIDTGSNRTQAKSILQKLDAHFSNLNKKYQIKAIINTHSHSDHCGGNTEIQKNTNCQIWLSPKEASLAELPDIQSKIIWGGNPPFEILNFFSANDSVHADKVITEQDSIDLTDGGQISFIYLPGHSFNDLGIIYTNAEGNKKVLFSGDSQFTPAANGKHLIYFMMQPQDFVESLNKIKTIPNLSICVPSHGSIVSEDIPGNIDFCIKSVGKTKNDILDSLKNGPLTTEQILKAVTEKNNIYANFILLSIIKCTIESFLGDLKNQKLISLQITENELLWSLN